MSEIASWNEARLRSDVPANIDWMAFSRSLADCVAHGLAYPVASYIVAQRDRLSETAVPLSASTQLPLRDYFSTADLERIRIVRADPLPIPDPFFYPALRWFRLDLPEPSLTEAITFDDLIASRDVMTPRLLFHELVHTVQYRLLGVKGFAHLYVRGFLAGGGYDGIPLERVAFELDGRFGAGERPFSVEAEVRNWLSRGRY